MTFVEKIEDIGEVVSWIIKIYGPFFKAHHYDDNTNKKSSKLKRVIITYLSVWWLIALYLIFDYLDFNPVWFEVQAKNGDVYNSTSTGQIRGHIDNLNARFPNSSEKGFLPTLNLVTTSNVKVSPGVINRNSNVHVSHYQSQYRVVNGQYSFRFVPVFYPGVND